MDSRYSIANAASVLRISKRTVRRYYQQGTLLLDRSYVDGLAGLLVRAKTGLSHDATYVTLHHLQWRYRNSPQGLSPGQLHRLRQPIVQESRALIESGEAVPLRWLQEQLQDSFAAVTVERWAWRQKIACVMIADCNYLSMRYAQWLVTCFATLEPISVAAARLNVKVYDIRREIKLGHVSAWMGPDKVVRVPRNMQIKSPSDPDTLSIQEFADRLGVSPGRVLNQVTAGLISVTPERRVPISEFKKWQRHFNTINPGFEWLQQQFETSGKRPAMMTRIQLCHELRACSDIVSRWSQWNFLPFFIDSFSVKYHFRLYPRLYVFGLKRFLTGRHATAKLLREYHDQCCAQQRIV